jgi:hypothetical protein
MGSWILASFGTLSAAAAGSEVTGWFPRLGRLAGAGSAVFGPPLATYTAVLLANTAVPAWHEAYPELPFLFAGSALASGGGVGLVAAPAAESAPARRMLLLGAAVEIGAGRQMEHRLGLVGEPYRTGRPGALLRAGRLLTGAAAATAVAGAAAGRLGRSGRPGRSGGSGSRSGRVLDGMAGVLANAGAVCTRFGVFTAGRASAADPRYTVIPQRERLSAE